MGDGLAAPWGSGLLARGDKFDLGVIWFTARTILSRGMTARVKAKQMLSVALRNGHLFRGELFRQQQDIFKFN